MQRRTWQMMIAGLAVGLFGVGAAAQWDIDDPPAEEPADAIERDDEAAEDDRVTLGTVDAVRAGEAYQRLEAARRDVEAPAAPQRPAPVEPADPVEPREPADPPADDPWGAAPQHGPALGFDRGQAPAQPPADPEPVDPAPAPAQPRPGAAADAIDQQMIESIRDKARDVADDRDIDLVVLEVLHDEAANVEQVDLTAEVIARFDEAANELADEPDVPADDADDADDPWDDAQW